MERQGPKRVASVEKAIEFMQLVEKDYDRGLGTSELARRAGLPKSTAYRLLCTLEATGALSSVDGHYRPGLLMIDTLAIPASDVIDRVQRVVTPFLASLFERTRMTVQLAALDGEVVFLNKLHGIHRAPSPSRIGGRAPAHCTSVGKALLAFDSDALERACARELERWTTRTITDPDELRRHVLRIRRTRVARDDGEYLEKVGSVASVVMAPGGEPVAALSVTGPRLEIRAGRFDPVVLEICARASAAYRRSLGS